MVRFSRWCYQAVNGRVVWATTLLFVVFSATVLPRQARSAEEYTAGGGSPDTTLIYTADDLYAAAERFGEEGRAAFVEARFTFDVIWPLVYALFLGALLTWLLARLAPSDSRLRLLNLAPWIGVGFDYLENVSTSIVMTRYPDPTPIAASLAPVLTFTKWIFVGGSFVLIAVALVALLVRRLRGQRGVIPSARPAP